MQYLLDTHALIWYLEDSSHLPKKAKELIDDPDNYVCVSAASLWEIAIKMSLCKLKLDLGLDELFKIIADSDFVAMQIENKHLLKLLGLPFIHKDPFDRLLIATAISEELTIISGDENIQRYGMAWTW